MCLTLECCFFGQIVCFCLLPLPWSLDPWVLREILWIWKYWFSTCGAQAGSVHRGPLIAEGGSVIKNLPANAGDAGHTELIPGLGGSPGIENGNMFQYSCLENSMDGGVWQATNPWGHKESDTTKCACTHIHTHMQGLAAKIFRTKSYQRQCGQREIP